MALRRLRTFFGRRRRDEALAEEMRQHVELRRQALIDEGWDADAAAREARRRFGNAVRLREEARDAWGFRPFDDLIQDVRYGACVLWRSRVFTLVAVLSLAGAIGIGVAIFAVTNAVLFRSIGVGDGGSLYRLFTADREGRPYGSSSYADYMSFAGTEGIFASTCAIDNVTATIEVDGDASLHPGELVSPDCFAALRLRPALGQFFSNRYPADGSMPIVVSHGVWMRRLAADASAVGRAVSFNGRPVTIVAVAPRGFGGTSLDGGAEFWAPVTLAEVTMPPGTLLDRRNRRFAIYARLRDGVDKARAEAALAVVASQLRRADERAWTTTKGDTRRVTVMRELDARFAQEPAAFELVFGSAIGVIALVLGIACVNLATMLLARGASRSRELSIRLALGASSGRVIRQLATESLLVSVAGGVLGVALVAAALQVAMDYRPAGAPAFDVALDWRVLLFAVGAAIVASLLFGVAPATHALKLAVAEGMKAPSAARRIRRLRVGAREALIVLQVTASLAMLLISTLFVRASMSAGTLNPGFDARSVVTLRIGFEALDRAAVPGVVERLLDAAQHVPGVERAALAHIVPMAGERTGFEAAIDDGQRRDYFGNIVSPGYFAMLRIPVVAGRDFELRDGANAARVAIVSETFARMAWNTPDAVGRVITMENQPITIVGVVADTRYFSSTEPFQALLYLPTAQRGAPYRTTLHARVNGEGAAIAALERTLREVDARLAVERPVSLNARIDAANAPERFMRWIGIGAGGVQLGLALMALWGLVAYAVERQAPEWGVRMALGAAPASLVRLSVRPAAVLIAAGVLAGSVAGAVATQVLRASGMSHVAIDLHAAVPLAMAFATVALFAAWWPARRAGRVDPASLLRRE